MGRNVAEKIKLPTVEELLGAPSSDGTLEIDISSIHGFKNHPFKVIYDERMEQLAESIRENGILNPVIVRQCEDGTYEMISGHRRMYAAQLAGLVKITAMIKDFSDDDAVIAMVDSNIQREELLPSERAFAFKMKMDALKRQGKRNDLTSDQNGPRLSAEAIGGESNISATQVKRYIRLTELIPELLDLVDQKNMPFTIGVELSYLDSSVQEKVNTYITNHKMVKPAQVAALRNTEDIQNLTEQQVFEILEGIETKKKDNGKVAFSGSKLNKYFPKEYSSKQREHIILQLLEQWSASMA